MKEEKQEQKENEIQSRRYSKYTNVFGVDTYGIFFKTLNIFRIGKLIKSQFTNFLLTDTFRLGTVFKKQVDLVKTLELTSLI